MARRGWATQGFLATEVSLRVLPAGSTPVDWGEVGFLEERKKKV